MSTPRPLPHPLPRLSACSATGLFALLVCACLSPLTGPAFAAPAAPAASAADWERNWPQPAGPNGSWSVEGAQAPVRWSVARNENILWKTTLPEEGQSGIAVWNERVFLTTLKPEDNAKPKGRDVVAYCLDARDGRILWTADLPGQATSTPAYFFSDATSPSPLTDGEHVWFFNACGSLACYDFAGNQKWLRQWTPTGGRPFNKQFEPMLAGDALLNMEPRDADDPKREPNDPWNYIRALDKRTGKTLWVAEDALTHYNTPVFGKLADGTPALLQGRGAYHGVPELPVGLSLTSLAPGKEGRTLWRFEPASGKAAYTQHWNSKYALWIDSDASQQVVLDAASGKVLRTQSLTAKVDWRRFDPQTGKRELLQDVDLSKQTPALKVFPAQFCNILVGDWHVFLCYTEAGKHLGPPYCVGRVHLETGKVEYLELPVSVLREPGKPDEFIWGKPQTSSTVNARGIDIVSDKRSQGDGWWWGYLGGPTAVGGNVYFTTMLGITYTVNARAAVLDEAALLGVSDLGVPGQSWSLNSLSHANGRLYHRSMKEVVCISGVK